MKVYILEADANRYQNLVLPVETWWAEWSQQFNGQSLKDTWGPIEVRVLHDEKFNKNLPPSDFPSFATHIPVFSRHAVQRLGDLLRESGEILPLRCDEGDYFALNVTRLVDALDLTHSKVKRFKSSGRIMDIVTYEFLPHKLTGISMFKLPQIPLMYVFVTDRFVQRVEEEKLTGFDFKLVWST